VLFGNEVPSWSSPQKALQNSLAMAYGRVDFAPMYDVAPLGSLIWLFGYVLCMVMVSMNMVLSIISEHYGGIFHENNAGDKGYDLFGQLRAMFVEILWNLSYGFRSVWRILYVRWFPWKIQRWKYCPYFPEEERRLHIPYENIYEVCGLDPNGYCTPQTLRTAGCDKATAKHMVARCEGEVLRHLPEHYPMPMLFEEFDESMEQYYDVMDHFSNELRSWFSEKSVATSKMIPRQTKLNAQSSSIEVAQHREHKHHHHHRADHMEGDGVHHHHHRSGNSQHDSDVHSQGNMSQDISRATSRAASKMTYDG